MPSASRQLHSKIHEIQILSVDLASRRTSQWLHSTSDAAKPITQQANTAVQCSPSVQQGTRSSAEIDFIAFDSLGQQPYCFRISGLASHCLWTPRQSATCMKRMNLFMPDKSHYRTLKHYLPVKIPSQRLSNRQPLDKYLFKRQ